MLRRAFLRRMSLTAAGLLVADDALELLTHRKVWAGHDFYDPRGARYHFAMLEAQNEFNRLVREIYVEGIRLDARNMSTLMALFGGRV